jgi:hypothetical protein
MSESTKVLTVMQGFPGCPLLTSEVERRLEPGQRPLFGLLIPILAFYDFLEFLGQYGTHAGATPGGNGASLFQKRFVDGESDVLLHGAYSFSLCARNVAGLFVANAP